MKCSYCGAEINKEIDSYYMCQDNFLQVKYFDSEEENVFCSEACFCNALNLTEIEPEEISEFEDA